ncbi:MAG: Hpt protein [Candidatus Solibacter sp.]|jgi:HPt (histidine-containing phosphotransfer) domain-containing protein|nr:Hpt protein [Candidatus Solibacter sp.]
MAHTANAGWVLPAELHHLAQSGGEKVIEELIELFKQDVGERLHVLRKAVESGDLVTAASQAHSIKGSALQMGAVNLVTTCKHVELDAAHHVSENLERLVLEAEAELRVLASSMRLTQ